MTLIDAVARFIPGVLGKQASAQEDSFAAGLLDCPHYTRPEVLDDLSVPPVLMSGNHEEIRKWRLKKSLERTWLRRPELLESLALRRIIQMSNIIKQIEQEQLKQNVPSFRPGDTLEVKVWVVEGSKRRLQAFEGVVIAIRNRGLHSAFTLRKVSNGVGVERVFQTHSPAVDSISVKRKGAVRKAKLYYLRERSGKSARIKERLGE